MLNILIMKIIYILKVKKLIYNEIKNIIFSKNETFIKIEDKYEINSSDVLYDRNNQKI